MKNPTLTRVQSGVAKLFADVVDVMHVLCRMVVHAHVQQDRDAGGTKPG